MQRGSRPGYVFSAIVSIVLLSCFFLHFVLVVVRLSLVLVCSPSAARRIENEHEHDY